MCHTTAGSSIELPATSEAPAIARHFVATTLDCVAHPTSMLDVAILLTSELVTNAVLHGTPPIELTVECVGHSSEIRVRDQHPRTPTLKDPTPLDTGGRGMMLVDLLADTWGVAAARPGKETWFRLRSRVSLPASARDGSEGNTEAAGPLTRPYAI